MRDYLDRTGDRSIRAYADGDAWIRIHFADGQTYEFTIDAIGSEHLLNLRQLARLGDGLPEYLRRFVPIGRGIRRDTPR